MNDGTWSGAFECLRAIRALEHNWDSYGSDPIPKIICDRVEVLLKMLQTVGWSVPSVVPCPDGSIQFEWHEQGRNEEWEIYVSRADCADGA